ncbi:MAG: NlpC/P60 family protein [Synechococcaceae cyanobacterium]
MASLRQQAPCQRSSAPTPPARRPCQRSAWGPLLAAWVLPAGLLATSPTQAAPPLRYQINLTAPASWWNDFPDRTNLILDHADPNQNNWSTFDYIQGKRPYGPTNPQLYSVAQSSIGSPSLVNALMEDRGPAVYQSTINQPPPGVSYSSWATARLMAAANRLIGTAYQHLHLPQFPLTQAMVDNNQFKWATTPLNGTMVGVSSNPYLQSTQQLLNNTPGNASNPNPYLGDYGKPAPGMDCTDFTAYIYNLALGYQLHSGTGNQVTFSVGTGVGGTASALALDATGSVLTPQFFYGPNFGTDTPNSGHDLDALIANFQPGDLLYIGTKDQISHVVVWLGAYGSNSDGSPSTVPLVISSHDNTPAIFTTQDINLDLNSPFNGFPNLNTGETINTYLPPPGVQILPFTNQNWFYSNFQVGMRLLPSNDPAAVPAPAAPLGLLAIFGQRRRRLRRRLASPAIPTAAAPG